MRLLISFINQLLAFNITEQKANYEILLDTQSFVNTNIKIEHGPIGWGFFASENIPAGEQLIRIDRRDQITIANVTETMKDEVLNWGDKVNDEGPDCVDGLTMFLLVEMEKGFDSSYFNYIQTLPTSHDTVLERWPERFDEFLQTSTRATNIQDKESAKQRYKLIQKLLGPNRFTFDQFHTAHLNVVSRFKDDIYPDNQSNNPSWLFDDEACGSMAPIFDMVNHSADPNCFWDFDSDAVWITAKQNIPMGSELFIDYGTTFNNELARVYGFTLKNSESYIIISESDVRYFHCTEELKVPFAECTIEPQFDIEDNAWIDDHCQIQESDMLQQYQDFYFGSFPGVSSNAELWLSKFLYWITEGRRREYFKINEKVQEYPFTSDELIYKSMIINLMKSEAIVVKNCLVPFQNQAVKKAIRYQNESDNL